MIDQGKRDIFGINVSAVDYEFALDDILQCAKENKPCATTALAVHGLMTGALDPEHRKRLNTFRLVTADGQPVRWALNLLHKTALKDRVYGPKLTWQLCQRAAQEGVPVYFYGSTSEVLTHLVDRLRERIPGIQIAGYEPSKFRRISSVEQTELVQRILSSGAKIVFVGLGCPRQEVFTYEVSQLLKMPVLAVGAAFDYHAGLLHEPPEWIQRRGLQWLYRLVQEPRRLWKRYVVTNSQFLVMLLGQWSGLWHPKPLARDLVIHDQRFG